jgi:hypothetical protein
MGTARPAPLRRWGCPGKRVAEMNSYAEIAALRWPRWPALKCEVCSRRTRSAATSTKLKST